MSDYTPRFRLFFAGFLIVAGTLLFLGNLGILPVRNIWSYWPLIVVGFGISRMLSAPDGIVRLFSGFVALFGVLFLLINLDFIRIRSHDRSWPISVLLIAFGIGLLFKALDRSDPRGPALAGIPRPSQGGGRNVLSDTTILGAIRRRVDSADFRGGNALSILGNIEIDLRHARVAEAGQTVTLEVSAILGAAKIRVPESWRVQMHGASIMGTYEDKTARAIQGVESPTLIITGYSFMSAIEVED